MKKIFFIVSILTVFSGESQQQEHLTQYQFNQFAFNPALAGSKSCLDIRGGYRLQWVGVDGAPETGFVNAHMPLKFKKGSRFGPKHGVGLTFRRDAIGPFSNIEGQLAYAIRLQMGTNYKLSFGTSFGFKQYAFDQSKFITLYQDNTNPGSQSFLIFPDARLGVWLTSKNEYFGFAINNLIGNKLDEVGAGSKLQRHFYITAGKKMRLQKGWMLIPSVMVLKTKNTPLDFHLSALFDLDNKIAFGVGLRRTDAITAQIRVKLMDFISIGYSFDFIISKLQKGMYQTHELTFGMNQCSNYGSKSTIGCATFE